MEFVVPDKFPREFFIKYVYEPFPNDKTWMFPILQGNECQSRLILIQQKLILNFYTYSLTPRCLPG